MNIQELYSCFLQCDNVSIDTRNITPNSLFFALRGENFDANEFAQDALNKGALFAVIDNPKYFTDKSKMLLVTNTLDTLQQLGNYHRNQLGLPIIAITGSNGKTTTKELIKTVLSQKYQVKATIGNYNNHIGVPLTLLQFDDETDIGIVEMGANHLNEIAQLCSIAQPDYGYITNFGKAHLEGFGSFEGVIKGKSELYDYLEDNHKVAFVNLEDPRQDAKTMTFTRYTFGIDDIDNTPDVVISINEESENASITVNNHTILSNLTGKYNSYNISAAATVGLYFGIDINEVKKAIESYVPTNNRSQWIKKDKYTILLDAYNANPSSMEVAIFNFNSIQSHLPKTYILGDMFELGKESYKEHRAIINLIEKTNYDKVFFIGKEFFKAKKDDNNKISYYTDVESFLNNNSNLAKELQNHSILVKGSRGMALEQLLEQLD